ncbi:MAG: response regulator [Candidatus Omnitrophica bacterium]|nr:response regulator [Candidatus Omnitrophota bacterium]
MNDYKEKGVILVVDDEKEVTMSLKGFFTALGYDMLTALDGTEALNIINSIKSPDLILLDVRMPGVDGIQILKHLRNSNSKAKVIIMTAHDKEIKQEVENIGVDGFFAKPIDLSKLIDRIRYVIDDPKRDTRVYPSKEKEDITSKKTPKARLLFIEPSPIVYGFTCGFFAASGIVEGEYETKVVYGDEDGLNHLYDYQPDIVIMYDSLFSMDDTKELAGLMMKSSHKPKAIILHGLFPKTDSELKELEKEGIRYCNQNAMDDERLRISNQKLVDSVAKECVRQGLIKNRGDDGSR